MATNTTTIDNPTDTGTRPSAGNWLDPARRAIGAACLVLGPLCFAGAEFTGPETASDPARMLRDIAAARPAVLTSAVLGLLSAVFLVPGMFAMLSRPLPRGKWFALSGVALSVWSLFANTTLFGANALFWSMTAPGVNRPVMEKLVDSLTQNPVAPLMLSGHFVLVLAVLLLGIGLWRAGIGPRWAAAAIGLAGIADVALGPVGEIGSIVSNAMMIAGFGAHAWLLVRERVVSES